MTSKPRDQSFDGMTQKFSKNIYATTKGKLRLAVLERDLQHLIEHPKPLRVLDVGGGIGQLNSLFAKAGHHVVHTDISAEIVTAAQNYHAELGLSSAYDYHVASVQELSNHLHEPFDVVLCHAVLEWLEQPEQALAILKRLMKPDGHLSLMFYNKNAKILANMVFGNFDYVNDDLQVKKKVKLSPQQPVQPEHVLHWLATLGLKVEEQTGVRCFHDYLRKAEDKERFEELLALELRYNQQPPFNQIGRYLHWQITQRA